MAKIVCDKVIGGVTQPRILTTTSGDQGAAVAIMTQAGQPFFWWPTITIPSGQKLVGVDFTDAPIATDDAATNNSLIEAFVATGITPEQVLTFGPI